MDRPIYSLHLFAGAGGGILADAYAGVEPVCADDPADLAPDDPLYLPRITERRRHRTNRIRALGNGQVPLCAAVAFAEGLATIEAYRRNIDNERQE